MSRRKGISFTLTIVVAGVILLMTALSVITLGGSSISSFFGTAGEQQTEALIENACNDKARQIQQNYCDEYIATAQISHDETGGSGEPSGETPCDNGEEDHPTSAEEGCSSNGGGDNALEESDDSYSISRSVDCSETQPNRKIPPQDPSPDGAGYYEDGGGGAYYYERTASEESCDWQGNAEGFVGGSVDPTVTVEGDEYNCLEEGYLQPSCPVQ